MMRIICSVTKEPINNMQTKNVDKTQSMCYTTKRKIRTRFDFQKSAAIRLSVRMNIGEV